MSRTPVPVIVNRRAGTARAVGTALAQRIAAAFAEAGLEVTVALVDGRDIAAAVTAQAAAPLIIVGGGDGTLGAALHARRGGGDVGVLALGTRNHLARDLGIPASLTEAARMIAAGHTRTIDLATVNGRGFVNNASVGLYPLMVRYRDAASRRRLPKWAATVPAAWAALARLPHHRMHLQTDAAADRDLRTPLLLVGNNRYALERGHVGERVSLDDGHLSVFAVAAHSRLGLLWFGLRALFGLSDPARDFAMVGDVTALIVRSRARTIDVALDGEVHRLRSPLRFAVLPRAIAIRAPAYASE